jgi:hypothetical protein
VAQRQLGSSNYHNGHRCNRGDVVMDASRFDTFARVLASGKPRRDALRVLAGAGVALAVAPPVRAGDGTCLHFEDSCRPDDPHEKCCKPYVCINRICLDCIKPGHTFCSGHPDCCDNMKCNNGTCSEHEKVKCEGNGCKKKRKHKKKH